MQRSLSLMIVASLVLLVGLAAAAASPSKPPFKVSSTLDGKTVLPHRIHWRGSPSLPSTSIAEVDFLIDGKIKWIEHKAPYSYSEDDGYLVTSWLTPGRHRFTVRAKASDGRKAEDTVFARVIPAPEPPAALAGPWQRNVDASTRPASAGCCLPSGVYTLVFERRWIQARFPGDFRKGSGPDDSINTGHGWINDSDWTPGSTSFHVQGAVTFRIFDDGPFGDQEGGAWCEMGGPGADYTWSISDNTLRLAPIGVDRCADRALVWTGRWTRVD
jgi:hypothetical protein